MLFLFLPSPLGTALDAIDLAAVYASIGRPRLAAASSSAVLDRQHQHLDLRKIDPIRIDLQRELADLADLQPASNKPR
jgi:hypothetical protein